MIVEDHPLFRDALAERLTAAVESSAITYSGGSLSEAVRQHVVNGSDCVILDLDLGDGRPPVANVEDLVDAGCRVLIVSALGNPGIVRRALQAGALGYNAHYANGLTAMFIACGQDVANVANSAVGITQFEIVPAGLYVSATLPALSVATVGGGTALATATRASSNASNCDAHGESPLCWGRPPIIWFRGSSLRNSSL